MKLQFIEDAKGAWKLLSLHVSALWAMVLGVAVADPMLFVTAWNAIPPELREFLPPWVRWLVAASAMFGTIYLARVVKQPLTKHGQVTEEVKKMEADGAVPSEEAKRALATAIVEEKQMACTLPPAGWLCTRGKGHDGPCAAVPISKDAIESHL